MKLKGYQQENLNLNEDYTFTILIHKKEIEKEKENEKEKNLNLDDDNDLINKLKKHFQEQIFKSVKKTIDEEKKSSLFKLELEENKEVIPIINKSEIDDKINNSSDEDEIDETVVAEKKRDLKDYVNNWIKFTKYGSPIKDNYIIPSKTFYMSAKADYLKNTEDYYGLNECLEQNEINGIRIETILDINYSNSYYNFYRWLKTNKNYSYINYIKIPLLPKETPTRKELNRLYDILNKNISKKKYLLIHCTNGVNRTGYVIIYFLCKRYGMKVDEANDIFEKSRGYKLLNSVYLNDLKQKLNEFYFIFFYFNKILIYLHKKFLI